MGYITTMSKITQYPAWIQVAALLTIVALIGSFIRVVKAVEPVSVEAKLPANITKNTNPVTAETFGFAVTGIVEAADSVTVRALTNGTVRSKIAEEGLTVQAGQVLMVQEVPLLAERMAFQNAQNGMTGLMQEASIIGRDAEQEGAYLQKDAASTSVTLTETNLKTGVETAAALRSVTSLVAALDFIDANESRFSGAALTEFRQTVNTLYGSTRTYLSGNVQYRVSSSQDVLDLLATLTTDEQHPDPATLLELANMVDQELDATKRVLMSGEEDFLDNRVTSQYGELYTAYLTYRGSVIEAEANLRLAIGGVRSALAGGDLGTHGVHTESKLRDLGYTTASAMLENAKALSEQSGVVGEAALGLLAGEAALGMPKAPFSGVIDEVFVKVGEFVPAGTPLFTIVGDGARKLTVQVPHTMLLYLTEGAPFVVDGKTVGTVARFSRTALKGNVTVVIELTDTNYVPGTTLRGEIVCNTNIDNTLALPRAYVRFDNQGATLRTQSGKSVPVTIIHDTGSVFLIKPAEAVTEEIVPAVGISF
jgi:membrane fusion protein (multidrug efflux system)